MKVDIRRNWWKGLSILFLLYTAIMGMLGTVPRLQILNETIRNLYFHVPMWFGMTLLLLGSMVYAIRLIRNPTDKTLDIKSLELTRAALMMGIAGLTTGMVWAKFTWGSFWTNDPKLNASALGMLIYAMYFLLRKAIRDQDQRARVSAVFNIVAFVLFNVLIFVLPRLTDSLHPGNGGNPGFNSYDLDSDLRKVFYVAVIGWFLAGLWLAQLRIRISLLDFKTDKPLYSE